MPEELVPVLSRDEIAQKVFADKIKNAVEAYADKLREYYPVKIFAKDLK